MQTAVTPTTRRDFEICMSLIYGKTPGDAIVFTDAKNGNVARLAYAKS